MAHKYSDFNAAYTAWSDKYGSAQYYCITAINKLTELYDRYPATLTNAQLYQLIFATRQVASSILILADFYAATHDQSYLYESVYWAAQEPVGGEITWDSLLNLMLTAQPEHIQKFIGLVDAYRQSLWNKPFNAEFYAALARGFE